MPENLFSQGFDTNIQKYFDILSTYILILDKKASVVKYANRCAKEFLSISIQSFNEQPLKIGLRHKEQLQNTIERIFNNENQTFYYNDDIKIGSNWIPVQIAVSLWRDNTLDGVLLEITELTQQWQQNLLENKMQQTVAHQELLRHWAHEVKNPLGGLRGAAQLLQLDLKALQKKWAITKSENILKNYKDNNKHNILEEIQFEEYLNYLSIILSEADRLQSLLDKALLTHKQNSPLQTINIHEVCEYVIQLTQAQYPTGLNIIKEYDISIPDIEGNRAQLVQVILNLAQNATYAMREQIEKGQGELIFKTRVARQVRGVDNIYKLALILHIIDNGEGFDDSMRQRMFLPFVSGSKGGTGWGLTLVQAYVAQHNGSVECSCENGQTEFKIILPL